MLSGTRQRDIDMKVLAIIPACEGSAILPNKNMRIIHGKPMIYYVIRNALQCRYITDVIVTSNSSAILSVAKRMDVMTRCRAEEYCNAQTSLDAVVFDVFRQLELKDYNCVVTMQSISPTLRIETLDSAFARYFSEDCDTMISVKNQAQFYWTIQGEKAVPMQKQRMNRHCLPPFYMETGGFLITKSCFIRENSRIGNRVALYELSGDEAIDVNSFGDLKQAENAMSRQSSAIFVNGNNEIGLGHISRAIQIADEQFTKPDFYYDQNITDPSHFGNTTYNIFPVNGAEGFAQEIAQHPYDIIINDVLNTSQSYMEQLRRAAPYSRIINFEDSGEGAQYADIVINALYEDGTHGNIISGSRYYIVPKLFLLYEAIRIKETVENVIVTFGGADPMNYTETVLRLTSVPEYQKIHFYVVLGKANRNKALLSTYAGRKNVTLMYDIDNMAEIMSGCDVAVSSRGRTCFELAALGIPTLSIAQHAREEQHRFVCEENGFICLRAGASEMQISSALKAIVGMSREERMLRQDRMLRHDLRNGRKNVSELIYSKRIEEKT